MPLWAHDIAPPPIGQQDGGKRGKDKRRAAAKRAKNCRRRNRR